MVTATRIPMASITVHADFQQRHEFIDVNHVSDMKLALDENPNAFDAHPITVVKIGDKRMLVDGFHRYKAHTEMEINQIMADEIILTRNEGESDSDYHERCVHHAIEKAVTLNNHKGSALKRTAKDKRKAALALMSLPQYKNATDTQIANALAVSSMFIGNLRRENPELQTATRTTRNGRTMDVSGMAKPAATPKPTPAVAADDDEPEMSIHQPAPAATPTPATNDSWLNKRVRELEDENEYLNKRVTNLVNEINGLEDENDELVRELEELKSQLEQSAKPTPEPPAGLSAVAAKKLEDRRNSKPYKDGKPISDVVSNLRRADSGVTPDERAIIMATLAAERLAEKAVMETVD
jgi:hypothetical protein